MACNGCEVSVEAVDMFQSQEKNVEFLQNHGVTLLTVKCTTCGQLASLNKNDLFWPEKG